MFSMHEATNQPSQPDLPFPGTREFDEMAAQAELDFQKELALQKETKATEVLLASILDDAAYIGAGHYPFRIVNGKGVDLNIIEAQHGDPSRAYRQQRQDRLRIELVDSDSYRVEQHIIADRETGTNNDWAVQFSDYQYSPHSVLFRDSAPAPITRQTPNAPENKVDKYSFTPRDVAAGEQTSQDVQRVAAVLHEVRTQIEQERERAAAA